MVFNFFIRKHGWTIIVFQAFSSIILRHLRFSNKSKTILTLSYLFELGASKRFRKNIASTLSHETKE